MSSNPITPPLTDADHAVMNAVRSWQQGPRALFVNALTRTGESYLEAILRENAVVADGSYICLARDHYLPAKSDVNAVKVAAERKRPSAYPLFAGPFQAGDATPKDRLTLGRHQVFTYEYDRKDDPAFFLEQISWGLPVKEWKESPYGKLHAALKTAYADFALMSVVWSGNKSFHIHLVFDTTLYRRQHGDPAVESLHAGHHAHWEALAPLVRDCLKPSSDTPPDDSVSWQTNFRRTPDGLRKIDKANHPLGLRVGSKVRQLVIWEQTSMRKQAGTTDLFLSSTRYPTTAFSMDASGDRSGSAAKRESAAAWRRFRLSDVQVRHVESHLRAHFATPDCGLLFSHLDEANRQYRAMLRNGPDDLTPSSYIQEGYATPRLVGIGAGRIERGNIPPLPLPLGQMITVWCSELDQTSYFNPQALEAAYKRLNLDLPIRLLVGSPSVLIHAPEGIRKTSTIMQLIHLSTLRGERGRPSMFACSSYANAREKAREFNFPDRANPDDHRGDGYVGIYWPSATELYRECARKLGFPELTYSDVDEAEERTLWGLIERHQPLVWEEMRRWHAEKMQQRSQNKVVLFTAHEVAFRWRDNSMARRLFAPDVFTPEFNHAAAHAGSRLNWLVVDEISYPMFVDVLSPQQVRWLTALRDGSPKIWSSRPSERQREHYANHIAAMEGDAGLDFFVAQRVLYGGLHTFQPIPVRDIPPEYPLRGEADKTDRHGNPTPKPYACDGEIHYLRPRDWWRDGQHRVATTLIMTTTEAVPAAVVSEVMKVPTAPPHADDDEADTELIYYAPNLRLGRDPVEVYASGKIVAHGIPELTAEYHDKLDTHLISNKLRDVENATSHFEARGVNNLADKDIVQIVTMYPPEQYKELRVIGSWLGRDDIVRLAHVDQINQSCGRNRGPRNRGRSHLIKINLKLFRLLNGCPSAMKELRYSFRTKLDTSQKNNAKRGK